MEILKLNTSLSKVHKRNSLGSYMTPLHISIVTLKQNHLLIQTSVISCVKILIDVCVSGGCGHPAGGGEAGKDQRCVERTAKTTLQVHTSAALKASYTDLIQFSQLSLNKSLPLMLAETRTGSHWVPSQFCYTIFTPGLVLPIHFI